MKALPNNFGIQHVGKNISRRGKFILPVTIVLMFASISTFAFAVTFQKISSVLQVPAIPKPEKITISSESRSDDLGILKSIKVYLGNGEYHETTILFIDPEQLITRKVSLLLGDTKHVFDSEKSVLISEKAANSIFDHKHPNCLLMECGNSRVSCTLKITGIIRDPVKYFGVPVDYIVSKKLLDTMDVH